jgi:nucleolin
MTDVAALEKALAEAKAAHKANKEDKALKKVYKAAKKALAAGQEQAKREAEAAAAKKRKAPSSSDDSDSSSDDEAPKKKQKVVTLEDLQNAAKAAKAAYKANKADKTLKAAYKAAKKAADDFKPAAAAEAPKEEAKEEEAAPDLLASLNKSKAAVPPPASQSNDGSNSENTKLFVGNLSWDIDDDGIKEFFKDCGGEIIDVYWLTDKESGRFKGCGFVTFDNLDSAKKAFAKKGQDLMGRDISIDYAKARPGGERKKAGGKSPFAGKGLSERPDNCTTTFCGNLSFDIDDDGMRAFAEDCGEIKAIRWLTDRDSGDFKGCGFVEFYDSGSVDNFVKKNGKELMGRPIRIDYSKPRN